MYMYMYVHMIPDVHSVLNLHSMSTHTRIHKTHIRAHNSSPSPDKIRTKLSNVRTKMPNSGQILQSTFKNVRTIFKCCCEHCTYTDTQIHRCTDTQTHRHNTRSYKCLQLTVFFLVCLLRRLCLFATRPCLTNWALIWRGEKKKKKKISLAIHTD